MSPQQQGTSLVLASTSRYRRALLTRLGIPFTCVSPEVEEARLPGEEPEALALRLAREKARSVASHSGNAVVVGADQVAVRGNEVVGKPVTHAAAFQQLKQASGQSVEFLTAVCLEAGAGGHSLFHLDHTRVFFKSLGDEQIERYLRREKPYDCAGSFKCEGLGIALFEKIESCDPTALMGLPLIWLAGALEEVGIRVI